MLPEDKRALQQYIHIGLKASLKASRLKHKTALLPGLSVQYSAAYEQLRIMVKESNQAPTPPPQPIQQRDDIQGSVFSPRKQLFSEVKGGDCKVSIKVFFSFCFVFHLLGGLPWPQHFDHTLNGFGDFLFSGSFASPTLVHGLAGLCTTTGLITFRGK